MNEESIKERVDNFQKGFHETHREIYETLHDNQNPHTLFIGCSDSRILPDQILQSVPGEVFMLRNVGNMMPPFEKRQDYPSPVSSMEYAVKVLKVEKIIIKGITIVAAAQP
jgi:carbonic anhydrase